jgi:peroxiredoxin
LAKTHLQEGQQAPDFDRPDGFEKHHRLADYAGQRVLLFFYGRDDTPM